MATRSITDFGPGIRVYRHWDGQVAGAGADLLTFLELDRSPAMRTGSRIGDPSYLAARWVAYLGHQNRSADGPVTDFLSVGVISDDDHWGAEYHYSVSQNGTVMYREVVARSEHDESRWGEWLPLTREVVDRAVAFAANRNPDVEL